MKFPHEYLAILKLTSNGNTRKCLEGVGVDLDKKEIACTDGKGLLVFPIETTTDETGKYVIPANTFEWACKLAKKNGKNIKANINFETVEGISYALLIDGSRSSCIEGSIYPNYHVILDKAPDPAKDPEVYSLGVDPTILLNMAKALGNSQEVELLFRTNPITKRAILSMKVSVNDNGSTNRTGLLMPMF